MYTFTNVTINLRKTGLNIAMLREKNHLSVRDLQRVFNFENPNAIYKWQNGKCLPSIDNLVVLSFVFGVSIEEILVVERTSGASGDKPDVFFCFFFFKTVWQEFPKSFTSR